MSVTVYRRGEPGQPQAVQVKGNRLAERDWQEPASIDEAEERYLRTVEETQKIDAQLSQKNRSDEFGQRLVGNEYHQWRARAVFARQKLTAEARLLKAWVKRKRHEASALRAGVLAPDDPKALLLAARDLIKKLADEGVDIDADEWALIETIERYLGIR